jgi:2-polyprenyl-3-methyl-5-hydroxy-6-metoxy-1,4-benzoquinol methylase
MSDYSIRKELHEQNRLSWNEATKAHNSHKGNQAKFFRDGGSTLFPEEVELLGDISGLSVVHLQCNSGQDSLSLARLGANVTGVDISDSAIAFARQLSLDSGIDVTFYRDDVFDWLENAAHQNQLFDIVFCSYGAICWISNLHIWAKGIKTILNPGGRIVLVDFHPVAMMFDVDYSHKFNYFMNGESMVSKEGVSDYVAESSGGFNPGNYQIGVKNFRNPHVSHEFEWGIGEIITALLQAGLKLEVLREYPYSNGWKPFKNMHEDVGRRMFVVDNLPNMPLMFGIVARK